MVAICPSKHRTKTKAPALPNPVTERELELVAIIAAAEMAFDQVCRGRRAVAA